VFGEIDLVSANTEFSNLCRIQLCGLDYLALINNLLPHPPFCFPFAGIESRPAPSDLGKQNQSKWTTEIIQIHILFRNRIG
jgi:hypothetical protein